MLRDTATPEEIATAEAAIAIAENQLIEAAAAKEDAVSDASTATVAQLAMKRLKQQRPL